MGKVVLGIGSRAAAFKSYGFKVEGFTEPWAPEELQQQCEDATRNEHMALPMWTQGMALNSGKTRCLRYFETVHPIPPPSPYGDPKL